MSDPDISVVMATFNGVESLWATLDSVLEAQDVELELIVVDDGSTDGSGSFLDERAALDSRLRVIHQANAGLTSALSRGCAEARGEFIARQDSGGDLSLPGRLRRQLEVLRARPEATMVSCGTRFVGESGEFLFEVVLDDVGLDTGLHTLAIPGICGPSHHGSTLFRREAYERCGGYRVPFAVAQDMDLWLRMVELGPCITVPEILYQARYEIGSISSRLRDRQFEFGAIAIECARARRQGLPEPPLPQGWNWADVDRSVDQDEAGKMHYFLGSCLRGHDRRRARTHFVQAVRARPTHWRAWLGMLRSYVP